MFADAAYSPRLDEGADLRRFVRLEIVEEHDIVAAQARRETIANPDDEGPLVHGAPLRVEHAPSRPRRIAPTRCGCPPVHRPRFDVFVAPLHPHMRPAHCQIRSGFVEEHHPVWPLSPAPLQERLALGHHIRPVDFTRPRPCFLTTKPSRASARWKAAGLVRWDRGARRLYSAHISAMVASGPSRARTWRTATSIGERQPLPGGPWVHRVPPRASAPPSVPRCGGSDQRARPPARTSPRSVRTPSPPACGAPGHTASPCGH